MNDKESFGIEMESYQRLTKFLKSESSIDEVILFGSRAIGHARKGSDIDLALKGPLLTSSSVSSLRAFINQELPIPYSVDLVHYDSLENTALKHHIDTEGIHFFKDQKTAHTN
ncbi:nucleotidyltransferase family protein [Marinilactibacillus piezotolerans]|uniref:nucleotidyltransferase family protein n=1 Tax=Marinilactibacillus piezotolerans TaxID=258723 RepID=UPI0009B07E23|nr:nucleotidyltransferase domain-containing protein [Marinilactibacillus piezotolerans]